MFVHTLPTTRAVSFTDHLIATSFTLQLTQTTEKRSRVQQVIQATKESKTASSSSAQKTSNEDAPPLLTQKEWLKVVQAAEDYIPYVYGLDRCLKTDDILHSHSDLVFTWKETLSSSPAKVPLPGVQCELLNVLLLNAKATSNLAASLVASVGSYEVTEAATLSDEDRKKKEERLKFAADLLCRAAGMFDFCGNELVREWESAIGVGRLSQLGRGIDSTREICFALSRLAQAEAEQLAIRKLLSPTLCYQQASRTSPPPLPSGHPSPSLLSKLFLNVASLLESALSLSQTASSATSVRFNAPMDALSANAAEEAKKSSTSALRDKLKLRPSSKAKLAQEYGRNGALSNAFMKYLTKSHTVAMARAYLWLGVDRGERGQYGESLAFLQLAREEVESLSSGKKISIGPTGDRKRDERRKFSAERESTLAAVLAWSKSYTQLNDTVGFQPIPQTSQLATQIPAGRGAMTVKPYKLPMPAFGPGSAGYEAREADRWQMAGVESMLASTGLTEQDGNGSEAEYAGKGAYY
jgi:hypothetical protein